MKHTIHPLTDAIGHFSRQSRRMALCAGLGLLLILGSLGYGSYWLLRQNTELRAQRDELEAQRDELKAQRDNLAQALVVLEAAASPLMSDFRGAFEEVARSDPAAADALKSRIETLAKQILELKAAMEKAPASEHTPAMSESIVKLGSMAAEVQKIAAEWGWYAVLASYRTEKEARSAASRAVNLEGLRDDIIGVYLTENGDYALTLGGEFTDRDEAQGKVEKAKRFFAGADLRYGKNWIGVPEVGGSDAAE